MTDFKLATFAFSEMMTMRSEIRSLLDAGVGSQEEVAQRIVRYLFDSLVDGEGRPACALVRLFKTMSYGDLDDELRRLADRAIADREVPKNFRCMVLLSTAGVVPEWNSRRSSINHQVLPLGTRDMIESAPMISQLFQQLGLDVDAVIRPDPAHLFDPERNHLNIFHVQQALDSPYVPAQDFVARMRIQSVLAFGSMVGGDLWTAILFSRIEISPSVADLFKVIGLNLKLALLPAAGLPVFAQPAGAEVS